MKRRILLGSIAVLVAIGIWAYLVPGRAPVEPAESPPQLETQEAPAAPGTGPAPRSAASPAPAAAKYDEAAWKAFQERFGKDLIPEFSKDGRLIAIKGGNGGYPADGDYRSDDPQKVVARAREIVDRARDLLGIDAGAPLGNPIARAAAASAQVGFQETVSGTPVAPHGHVNIDLGAQGELLHLESGYVPGLKVTNDVTLDPEELKSKALGAAAGGGGAAPRVSGGSPVIWVTGAGRGSEGRHAYQYWSQGHQIVIDASTGEVLLNRDRRNF